MGLEGRDLLGLHWRFGVYIGLKGRDLLGLRVGLDWGLRLETCWACTGDLGFRV